MIPVRSAYWLEVGWKTTTHKISLKANSNNLKTVMRSPSLEGEWVVGWSEMELKPTQFQYQLPA